MSTRQDYLSAIDGLVPGKIPLGESDKIIAINMSMKQHSKQKPLPIIEDETGDGGFDYAITDLTYWSDGFSAIKRVEYPVNDDDETPDVLADDAWTIYSKPAGDYLRFLENTPLTTESFRVTYTGLHTCTVTACSVKTYDEEAVQALCAAFFCSMLSTYYAQAGDSTISADSVDHKSRSDHYAARARMYRKMYFDHLGIKDGQTPPASVTRDQDKAGSWGSDRLTHKSKYR